MISRNYLQVEQNSIYRINLRDYARIKDWLQKSKKNYQSLQTLSSSIEYYPLNYVFAFKRITLNQNFINKYIRVVNHIASNGVKILAGVFNSKQNVYVAKSYEKRGIFCKVDIRTRTIEFLEQILLAFYTLGERHIGTHNSVFTEVSPNVKALVFVVQFELISNDGQIFNLGQIKYKLENRATKQTISDLEITRLGQKQSIGYSQCHIQTPERLGLSYFIPSNYIIDRQTVIPPCKTVNVKDKTSPYTLFPMYNINIQNLQLTINNYNRLLNWLKRCSPFFTDYHHDRIKVEVQKITLLLGFHNSYRLLNDLPIGKQRQKQRQKLRQSPKNSTGKSRVFTSMIQSKQIKKNVHFHYVYKAMKMMASQGNQSSLQNQRLKLITIQSAQIQPMSQLMVNEQRDSIGLIYFDIQGGHLIGVLQFTIKFTLQGVIKQEQTIKMNLFWTPITFDASQPISQVKLPMIDHIELPGYPIEWNEMCNNNNNISAIIKYRCVNNNPQLWQNTKKQRMKSFKTIGGSRLLTQKQIRQKSYYDLLIDQLQQKQKEEDRENILANNLLKIENAYRTYTQTSQIGRDQQIGHNIEKMLRMLEINLKPRLKLKQNRFGISPDLLIPKLLQQKPVAGISLVGKSYQLKIRLREYLPMTDSPEQYYIPRKMHIKIYGFRQVYEQIVLINKNSVKAGIPIQLQHPSKFGYEGFIYQFNLDTITAQEAGAYEEGNNIIVTINDLQNMLYFGSGEYPSIELFHSQKKSSQDIQQSNNSPSDVKKQKEKQSTKHIRMKIKSKQVNERTHIRGYLLFDANIQQKQNQQSNNVHSQQIKLQKVMNQMSAKERQMLRINAFNGKEQANMAKAELITKYKQNNKYSYVKNITNKQINNDVEIDYEIGKPAYAWLKLNNTDKSQNNLFAFYLNCDFIELVTDKQVYQRQALMEAKQNQSEGWRSMPNLTYVMNKQGSSNGHYEARIVQGSSIDILIKVLHNQWTSSLPDVTIAKIQVKRNTFPFRDYKLRLNHKKPLIDKLYHIQWLWSPSFSELKVKVPNQIVHQNGDFINTLSPNTIFNTKQKILILCKISQQSISQQGSTFYVLLGAYYDKQCQNLKRCILIQLQCMQGQQIKLNIGDLQCIKIPIMSENLRTNDRVYRIETSNDQYQLKWQRYGRLCYYSKTQKNQPQMMIRCLRPIKDDIVVSVISLENKLIKKYLIVMQCVLSPRIPQQIITAEGYVGQKITFILKNPYHTDFGFYLSSTNSQIVFNDIQFEKKESQQFIFKIKSRSQIRITAQINGYIRPEQCVVQSDFLHHVACIYLIRTRQKKKNDLSKKLHQNLSQDQYIPFFGNDFHNTPKLG